MGVARAALWLFALVALSAALLTLQPRSAAFAHATVVAHEPAGLPAAHCSGSSYHPDPTPVEVTGVPIVVESTTEEYFVLYVKHEVDGTELELPVLVKKGAADATILAENVEALPRERYRVEKYLIADPADVDGDCIDDISELADPVGMNPVNPAPGIEFSDGAVTIPDRETLEALAMVSNDGRAYLKFILLGWETDSPGVYFVNMGTHPVHRSFLDAVGLEQSNVIDGSMVYDPELVAPDGSQGLYYFWPEAGLSSFSLESRSYTLLAASVPLIEFNLALHIPRMFLPAYEHDLPLFEASRINLFFKGQLDPGVSSLALNRGRGVGLLRDMDLGDRPNPREVVIYQALPNELPRVAGIITTVRQTPLSHVNVRAVQNGIPNAYIRDALQHPDIAPLLGSFVRYEVTDEGWDLRAATPEEVDEHYESSRPTQAQTPQRDLSATSITPLSNVRFGNWTAFGVKAANVAELGRLGFAAGTVPDGFAIPFHFYDEFMKAHGFHDRIEQMLATAAFQSDFDVQDDMLDDLRDDIEDADSPQWIIDALTEMHASFPGGTSLRYRSSTNNEDLPGFNGAGLYDSKTQDPEETEEDGIDKSLKGVFASLWNFRAFTEREFHRIDHSAVAMGVLVHPNYSDERANGVAASFDPFYDGPGRHYVNTQLGEDLVTNPVAHSVPEELLLFPGGNYVVLSTSNLVPSGQLLMSDAQLEQLAQHLTTIHDHFEALYNPGPGEPFAMEIEFKITAEDILAIKQARPWVFSTTPRTTTTTTTGGGGGGGGGPSGPTPSDSEFEWSVTGDIEELDSGHDDPTGAWSDGATLWLAENGDGADDAVYAYDLKTGERIEEREFELGERNLAPRGVWSDRTVIWISDSGQEKLFAHDLDSGERLPERDLALAERNRDARGIWSDGETMWVLDGRDDALFAYDLASSDLRAEHALDSANDDPRGLFFDGVTFWVSDHGEKRLFAYRLEAGEDGEHELERNRDEEFGQSRELTKASNNSPRGIWSDGDVMYVADASDGRVYSYNMPDAIDARLATLELSGVDFGEFSPLRYDYASDTIPDGNIATLTAMRAQPDAALRIEPADHDGDEANGYQVRLLPGLDITITVTSPDGSRERVYRLLLGQEEATGPAPDCLRGAVTVGFSLVVYEGGSVEDLVACSQGRSVTALYVPHEGDYVPHILGAPAFVNDRFGELYPEGLPALTPLIAKSEGPPSPAPASDGVPEFGPDCLRGEIATGFSLVLYEGGSVADLDACAASRDISAVYALVEGEYVPYILGAPDFVNEAFVALFPEGVAPVTPLTAKSN